MNETLLVVDDDPSLVNLMKSNFEEYGYRVVSGYDGQAALTLARSFNPQLIILDVNMPMTNGIRAMELLREYEETASIPIILLTGETSDRVLPQLQGSQRVTHLKKPIDLEELNSLVASILKK